MLASIARRANPLLFGGASLLSPACEAAKRNGCCVALRWRRNRHHWQPLHDTFPRPKVVGFACTYPARANKSFDLKHFSQSLPKMLDLGTNIASSTYHKRASTMEDTLLKTSDISHEFWSYFLFRKLLLFRGPHDPRAIVSDFVENETAKSTLTPYVSNIRSWPR